MEKKKLFPRRTMKKMRPLTGSEKFLLIALGAVMLIWGSNKFILTPQAEKMEDLQTEKLELDTRIMDMNTTLKKESNIIREKEILSVEREQILANYFPILDQAQIIYLMNGLVADNRVDIADYNFNRPSDEKIGEMSVKQMSMSLPFNGIYDGIVNVVKSIGTSPKRILVDSLSIDRSDNTTLGGNMSLKIYSLEGLAKTDPNVIKIANIDGSQEGSLFGAFSGFKEQNTGGGGEGAGAGATSGGGSSGLGEGVELIKAQLLHDFETRNYSFIPSNPLIKGDTTPSTIRKSGRYSLRFEYNMLALEDENRAYIDLSKSDITFKYPPDTVSMWVNAFGYSPGTLGMRLRTQGGEDIDVTISEGISWLGWSNLQTGVPMDLNLYPLTLTHLYFDLPYNRDDLGVLLIDKLEAFYPFNEDQTVNNKPINEFYIVEVGDNLSSISKKFYGTDKYVNEIANNNGMKAGEVLVVGKVLVMTKR